MHDVAWPMVVDALVRVERLAPDDCGVLSSEQPGHGGIFVERGRICWAAARGLQRRLTDLLRSSAAMRDIDLDGIYQRCRAEGRLLGQTLVDEGWMAPRELETALRRHSAESLVELCRGEAPLEVWSSRGAQGYAPRFTFRPLDVLLDIAELFLPHLQHSARVELAAVDQPGRRGGAFCLGSAPGEVVPIAAFGDGMSVRELASLGGWAVVMPQATRELGTMPTFSLAARASGPAVAVWWRAPLLFAVTCPDRRDAAGIATHHLALGAL